MTFKVGKEVLTSKINVVVDLLIYTGTDLVSCQSCASELLEGYFVEKNLWKYGDNASDLLFGTPDFKYR
jgi:hypothetical protein